MDFNKRDLDQIKRKGITPEKVGQQIAIFERGNIVVNIAEAATLKNGILAISEEEKRKLISNYNNKKDQLNILKFVPASGAATRMFKAFYNFLEDFDPQQEDLENFVDRKNNPKLELFFSRMKDLPFYEVVIEKIKEFHPDFEDLSEDKQQLIFVRMMLDEEGIDLGNQPKGLVPFHKYEDHLASAFEEHLREAVDYAASANKVRVHFTVAEEHREKFEAEEQRVKPLLEKETGTKFEISYSYQDPKTDTIAVTKENEPFRDENGELFFRPGGHGALIENLNAQDADIIFIKNIDNVVVPKNREVVAENKEMLAGKLLELQQKTFDYLKKLEGDVAEAELEEIIEFL